MRRTSTSTPASAADRAARDALVLEHLPLARRLAVRTRWRRGAVYDLEDLVMAGVCGLLEAADAYDPARGTPFGAFAYPYVHGRIVNEQRALDPLPRDAWRRPDRPRRPVSLEVLVGQDEDACPIATFLADPAAEAPGAALEWCEAMAAVHAAIATLPQRQRQLVELCCLAGCSNVEAARRLGVSTGSVSNSLWRARGNLARALHIEAAA
ncbi:MAG TPA: sigma-70 family RNA polymerase sigma factor [Actinomycetes bacterium]|jgi:RNA polymerase sigma factor (sigma-70 family)|nr:sigma-70 family RNA polymerase sigma factor [Actinomycetes bacterium]